MISAEVTVSYGVCAYVWVCVRVCLSEPRVCTVCVWSGRAAHTSSFNDALANATCTFDKDE